MKPLPGGRLTILSIISLVQIGLPVLASAGVSTSTTLASSTSQATLGQTVTLTAIVSPSTATGRVTFYEGITFLGTSTLTNGQATFATGLLSFGTSSVKALYTGDSTHGSSISSPLPITVSASPASGFGPANNYVVGNFPQDIAVGDLNGDGYPDLVAVNYNGSTVSVLLGNRDGTFRAAGTYSASFSPTSVTVADFNGDGKLDIAVGAYVIPLSVALGNGDGTFQPFANYYVGLSSGSILKPVDVNGDGIVDLIIDRRQGGLYVLLGYGDGTFQTGLPVSNGSSAQVLHAALGDFNGDGIADIVTGDNNGAVYVWLGQANATFTPIDVIPGAGIFIAHAFAVADFNGDGKQDFAFTANSSNSVTVMLGNGDGTFRTGATYPAGLNPISIATGDFNGDRNADIVVGNGSGNANVLLGNGDGTLQPGVAVNNTPAALALAVGDFNRDGRADLAVLNMNLAVLLGAPSAAAQTISFSPLPNSSLGAPPFTLSASASSGLPVTFQSNSTGVCTVSGSTVTLVSVGTCVITASQAGNSTWPPAVPVTQMFTVLQGSQTIVFGTLSDVSFGVAPFTISATTTSGLPVTFASTTGAVCNVVGNTVSIIGMGSCSITATQAGNANYAAATPVTRTFTVGSAFTITVSPGSISVAPGNNGISTITTAVSGGFNSTIGLSASGLPAGATVAFSPTAIAAPGSGNSTMSVAVPVGAAVGSYLITVAGTAGSTVRTANVTLTVTGAPLAITTVSLPNGQTGVAYSSALGATGGIAPYRWQLISGTLPAGLTLNGQTGQITGTPTGSITSTPLTFKVTDSTTPTAQAAAVNLALTIAPAATSPLAITTTSLPNGQTGSGYLAALTATGGVIPYTWQLVSGTLPAGLTLNPQTGLISGTPTVGVTNAPLTFRVSDSTTPTGQTATVSLVLTIASMPTALTITTTSLPVAQIGVPFAAALTAAGGTPPYNWSFASRRLPSWLALNPLTGQISGTPSIGSTNVTLMIVASDSTAQTATATLTLVVGSTPAALTTTTTSMPSGQVGVLYAAALAANGGTTPYSWQLVSGTLPAGLTLNPQTGQISGTPMSAITNSPLMFKVTDSTTPSAQTASVSLALTIAPAATAPLTITTTSLPSGQIGVSYLAALGATGGTAPYTWQLISGTLPAGLTLNPQNGQISGTPITSLTNTPLMFRVTDSTSPAAQTAAVNVALSIAPAPSTPLTITTRSLPGGQTGATYSASLVATGGASPYSWQLVSGTLPTGLTLNPLTGQISGTPTVGMTNVPLTFRVTDSSMPTAQSAAVSLTLTITSVQTALTITTISLPAAQNGVPYAASLAAVGGAPSYTWAVNAGRMPPGLTLNPQTGQITGTPTSGQMSTLVGFNVSDSTAPAAQSANVMLTLNII